MECYLGDNCIQNFHLGRYIVGYTVGNLVLRRRVSGAVKRDFRTYIRRYTSPNENFEYGYPHSNALLTFSLQKDKVRRILAHICQIKWNLISFDDGNDKKTLNKHSYTEKII